MSWFARFLMLLILSFAVGVRPALAQEILRDAETEQLFRDMERPIIEAAGLRPENVQILVLQDNSINAFVAGGQIVYVHSGLIAAADNVNQVQGVVAHEIGHIVGGHVIRMAQGEKAATGIMLLSLLLGAAAIAAGQQAAMGKFLAFSRTQESSADQAAAKFLNQAGISGKGLLDFFKKLQNEEYRYSIPQDDAYAYTHPLTSDRVQVLEEELKASPAWSKPTDPALEARFQRVKAKLIGYINDPQRTLMLYPESNHSEAARYARAYAWHKEAYPDRALAEMDSLLKDRPGDPFYLELKGQILLESGKPNEALASLREAVAHAPDQPLIASLLGSALVATEKKENFDEAKRVLRAAIARDNSNPFAWYQLGIVYDREGDEPRAALATAERYNLEGQAKLALANAEMAMRGIPQGSNDYLRAQDIAMVSRTQIDYEKKHHISEPK